MSTFQDSSSNTTLTVFPQELHISCQPALTAPAHPSLLSSPRARHSPPALRTPDSQYFQAKGHRLAAGPLKREHLSSKAPFPGDGPPEPAGTLLLPWQERCRTGWERDSELWRPLQGEASSGLGAPGPQLVPGEGRGGLSPGFSKHSEHTGAAGCHGQAKQGTSMAFHPAPETNAEENTQ